MEPAVLKHICATLETGQSGVLVMALDDGRSRFVKAENPLLGPIKSAVDDALRTGRTIRCTIAGHHYLLKPIA